MQDKTMSHFPKRPEVAYPTPLSVPPSQGRVQPSSRLVAVQNLKAANAAGVSSSKKSSSRPVSRVSGATPNSTSSAPIKTMELAPAVQKRSRNSPEKTMIQNLKQIFPEAGICSKLFDYESRLDALISRKTREIRESVSHPPHILRTLRVYVLNTFENQVDDKSKAASWCLKITGKILKDVNDSVLDYSSRDHNKLPKFSSFFKKIAIHLDQNLYPTGNVILWENNESSEVHDGFEVERTGDKEFIATIRFEMNDVYKKFVLSQPLSEILALTVETHPRILIAFWHYIKTKKLQDPKEPSFFICDTPLQKLFGEEKLKFSDASSMISQHLTLQQPIQVEHRIKLAGNSPSESTFIDISVDVPTSFQKDFTAFFSSPENQEEIDAYDKTIQDTLKKIHERLQRRSFFIGFSKSPAEFINSFMSSQSNDLNMFAGGGSYDPEKENQSNFYNTPWVEEAVIRYLSRKSSCNGMSRAM